MSPLSLISSAVKLFSLEALLWFSILIYFFVGSLKHSSDMICYSPNFFSNGLLKSFSNLSLNFFNTSIPSVISTLSAFCKIKILNIITYFSHCIYQKTHQYSFYSWFLYLQFFSHCIFVRQNKLFEFPRCWITKCLLLYLLGVLINFNLFLILHIFICYLNHFYHYSNPLKLKCLLTALLNDFFQYLVYSVRWFVLHDI